MVLSLIFVGLHLWNYRWSLTDQLANPILLLATLLSAVIYGISCFLLALGWWLIMQSRRELRQRIRWETMWTIYAKTQIAKYIPGNIFHLAGRPPPYLERRGPHSLLVGAAILEIIMLLLATELISLLAAGDVIGAIRFVNHHVAVALAVGGSLAGLVGALYLSRRLGVRRILAGMRWRRLFAAQLSYLRFSLISATRFLSLISPGTGSQCTARWQLIIGGYAFAWGVGFVVPGAPAGLGVREAALVGTLAGVFPENSILVSTVLFRVITTLGDNLFFLKATLFGVRPAGNLTKLER
jgi:glycosyltransferase 2 family protein